MKSMNTTNTRSDVDQSQVNEQLRAAILDKKQAQVEAWSKQIETLRAGLQDAAATVRNETEKRVADLTEARDQASEQLVRLQSSTQETWASILQQSDELFQDLAARFHAFADAQS
jgi:DNA anti-recombination protein RmuC